MDGKKEMIVRWTGENSEITLRLPKDCIEIFNSEQEIQHFLENRKEETPITIHKVKNIITKESALNVKEST